MGIFAKASRVSNLFTGFGAERKGSVAMMVGISFPLLFVAAGGALDYTNAVTNTQKGQRAMDSAVLALTRMDLETIDIQDEGETLFRSILMDREITANPTELQFAIEGKAVSGSALLVSKNIFLGFLGQNETSGRIVSKAIPPTRKPIEISLVLDVSGSMGDDLNGAPRIERLKDAVNDMFDTLDEELLEGTELSAAVVPYSSSVNLGDYRNVLASSSVFGAAKPAGDVWAAERYVASNGNDYTVNDAAPSVRRVPFVTDAEMNYASPTTRLAALTDEIDDVRDTVDAMTPDGWTAGHIGMAWGVYTLSNKWKNVWPEEPKENREADKIIVLLSDGEFNTTYNIGDGADVIDPVTGASPQNDNQAESDAYFQNICTLARNDGISIYAIALSLDAASEAKLNDCVKTSGTVYSADSADDLSNAFKDIARQLGQRRLTS